jgi:hypothetical protein
MLSEMKKLKQTQNILTNGQEHDCVKRVLNFDSGRTSFAKETNAHVQGWGFSRRNRAVLARK